MDSTSKQYSITKLIPDKKIIYKNDFHSDSKLEELYHEMKKIIMKETFDLSLISNLDSMHNILTKISMCLRCCKYICFNEYDYGAVKISNILDYLNSGEAKIVIEYKENINQKIYVLENSWN